MGSLLEQRWGDRRKAMKYAKERIAARRPGHWQVYEEAADQKVIREYHAAVKRQSDRGHEYELRTLQVEKLRLEIAALKRRR